ncbi:hypothetical protein D1AOALGA4SA_4520 [Olavius algarvensis Delta 1 endosymbiont]|nr:hypothetical protein D1AOALGA4SA_4520 [Olavius algarvensis Delta 1 endosymbiont]
MKTKHLKLIFLLIGITLISAVVFKSINEIPQSNQSEEKIFLRLKKNSGPVIRGFQYSNYHQGRKALNIRAAKFNVEKKKIGVFKFSPFKVARFRDAEIDFFGKIDHPDEKPSKPRNSLSDIDRGETAGNVISFRGVLSQAMLPPPALKGSISAICEPVKLNLYLEDNPVTMIYAEKGVVDPRRRRMIFHRNILVTSGGATLSTDRLAVYPETGLFEIENDYVLTKDDETITGEKLTTDFLLKKISM